MRNLLSATLLVVSTATALHAQKAPASAATAQTIVSDTTLFPAGFAEKIDWNKMRPDSRLKIWTAVPEPRPKLSAIVQKYGAAVDSVYQKAPMVTSGSVESVNLEPEPGALALRLRVHYYDNVGFAVNAALPDPAVFYITNRPAIQPRAAVPGPKAGAQRPAQANAAGLLIVRDVNNTFWVVQRSDARLTGTRLSLSAGTWVCFGQLLNQAKPRAEAVRTLIENFRERLTGGPSFMQMDSGKPWLVGQKGQLKADTVIVVKEPIAPPKEP